MVSSRPQCKALHPETYTALNSLELLALMVVSNEMLGFKIKS
jgi:hypothetical protein